VTDFAELHVNVGGSSYWETNKFLSWLRNYPHSTEPDGTYITGFTRSCHLSQIDLVHNFPSYFINKYTYGLLFSHLRLALPSGIFTSDFPIKNLYAFLLSLISATCPSHFIPPPKLKWSTRWRSWLRYCATSRKVEGSIPDGVIEIFHWRNPSGRTMALGLTQPRTEMSTRNTSWG